MPAAALLSFRLGGTDGVSVEAEKWSGALGALGFEVTTVAGEGRADHLVPGLAIAATEPPDARRLESAIGEADLVVVENLCSLPLNRPAAELVARLCRGRPTVLHHHDLSWQRPGLGSDPPPDDPAWRHVTVNELSRRELAAHGIEATTLYNRFDTTPPPGARDATRERLGVGPDRRLVLQPTRALPRKNVVGGLAVAGGLGATYWLVGPAEDGYGPELERLLAATSVPVLRAPVAPGPGGTSDAYAACDLVVLPSTWEGFGNPAVESAAHRRPLCIGPYPVAVELAAFGFEWFPLDDIDHLERWLAAPDYGLLQHNWEVADVHFSLRDLPASLASLLGTFPLAF